MTEQKPLLRQLGKGSFSKVYDVVCPFMSYRKIEAKSSDACCSCSISRTMLISRKTEIGTRGSDLEKTLVPSPKVVITGYIESELLGCDRVQHVTFN